MSEGERERWYSAIGGWQHALYASNTAGACVGGMLAGFLLVPMLGLQRTSLCAMGLNVFAGGLAMWLAAADATPRSATAAASSTSAGERPRVPRVRHAGAAPPKAAPASRAAALSVSHTVLAACALGLTGFAALVNEVAWTRVLALTIGPTTYAFSGMLTLFILGLAIGSAAAARQRLPRCRRSEPCRSASPSWFARPMWVLARCCAAR